MVTIGLTGGIACGKSTVAGILRDELNLPVIDADQVSRDITARGTPGLAWIIDAFGEDVLTPDGSLDRGALGAMVRADPHRRKQLEAITHPLIREEIEGRLTALEAAGAAVAVVEAALMIEAGTSSHYDQIVVVSASPEIQKTRLMDRNGWTSEVADQWIANQMSAEQKESYATVVVRNDWDLAALRKAVLTAWGQLEF